MISQAIDLNRLVFAALREVEVISRLVDLPNTDVSDARAMSVFFEDCRDTETLAGMVVTLAARAAELIESSEGTRHSSLLALAGVLLSHNSVEPTTALPDKVPLSWFLNLEVLFERAVRSRLRAVTDLDVSVSTGSLASTPVFRETGVLVADPDLVVRTPTAGMVGDVKYKNWTGTAEPSDMYQLLTHAAAFESTTAFLIYPADRFEAVHLTRAATGATVWLFAVDVRVLDVGLRALCRQLGLPLKPSTKPLEPLG